MWSLNRDIISVRRNVLNQPEYIEIVLKLLRSSPEKAKCNLETRFPETFVKFLRIPFQIERDENVA